MYKYMNNYFGKRHFRHANFKDAEPDLTDGNMANGGGGGSISPDGNPDDTKPSYDDLVAELAKSRTEAAQAKLDRERFKNSIDDLTKKNSELTKKVRESMTAEQQLEAAKKEREDAKDALIAEYQAKERVRDCTEFLMDSSIGMDKKTAKEFAQKFVEGDFDNAMPILEKHIKAIKDTAYQKALTDRPDPKAGNGNVNENSSAMAMAAAYAGRQSGVNMDILNQY